MSAISDLIKLFNSTPSGTLYHDISGALLKNLRKIENFTIEEIAEMCYTSPATISRLARSLNYRTFGDFRYAIQTALSEYPYLNRGIPFKKNSESFDVLSYLDTLRMMLNDMKKKHDGEYLNKILEEIHKAKKISLYSNYASDFSRLQFQYDLVMAGKETAFISDKNGQLQDARSLDEDCIAIIIIPNTAELSYRTDVFKAAKEAGAKILSICSSLDTSARKYSDYVLEFEDEKTIINNYSYNVYISILAMGYRSKYLD